jgi:hypothetical protein
MKEVTKEQFYKVIGPLDVVSSVIGDFPYTTEYKFRNGGLKGKVVDRMGKDDEDHTVSTYYLISL